MGRTKYRRMRILTGITAAAFLGLCASALPAAAQSAPGAVPPRVTADVVTSARQGKGVRAKRKYVSSRAMTDTAACYEWERKAEPFGPS